MSKRLSRSYYFESQKIIRDLVHGYVNVTESSFSYLEEKRYSFPFSTKGRKDYPANVSYFHRPIESYWESASEAGLELVARKEFEEIRGDGLPEILGLIFCRKSKKGRKTFTPMGHRSYK